MYVKLGKSFRIEAHAGWPFDRSKVHVFLRFGVLFGRGIGSYPMLEIDCFNWYFCIRS